jgi:hypothetical protein
MIDNLHASHLLRDLDTTICSGFNSQCHDKFKCLQIDISFLNETNFSRENFNTTVIVLKDSPIDLIIGRATIKK